MTRTRRMIAPRFMASLHVLRNAHWDHEPVRVPRLRGWDWRCVAPRPRKRGTLTGRFMESLDLQVWTRIGTMNLVDLRSFAPPRSVTAVHSDAPARAARWKDWFRPATRALTGEPARRD